MNQNLKSQNPSFNVFKLSPCHPSKITQNGTGQFSVTYQTMSKQCLQRVSESPGMNVPLPSDTRKSAPNPDNIVLEANPLVTSGSLRKGCFVKLKAFQANSVKGKKLDPIEFVASRKNENKANPGLL